MTAAVNTVLIVGAGIAGLGLATALTRAGVACDVVDVDDRPEGASIGLTGRAVDALEELGVLQDCVAAGNTLRGSVFENMYDAAGTPLPAPPTPPHGDNRLPGAVVILRARLAEILRTHAEQAGAAVRVGVTVEDIARRPGYADVTFTDGTVGHYDLVVGADGVRSKVRGLIHPGVRPEYTGHMSLRWVLPGLPGASPGFYYAPDATVVVGLLPGGLTYVSTGYDLPNTRVDPELARELMRSVLAKFTAPTPVALRERVTEDADIIVRPYEWLLVPDTWNRGRVVVIGDAAHATTAHLASGGGMALEDAVVLAQELRGSQDVEQALARFMTRRFERVRMVVETSVELLLMDRAGGERKAMGMLRGQAMATLAAPY